MVMQNNEELIVQAVGLTKTFNDFWMRTKANAVNDIDFEIRRNEIFGLLGPNGSGKSTTIKMILGLLHKTRGRLLVFGRAPSDVTTKKYIGFLPEESYLYRYLTARETLDYYGKLFGIERRTRRRRTDELLDMVGLSQVGHRAIGEFSKGMTRRIGIAQALINDPEFLILDEPTSGLDPIGTRQVKDLILQLGERKKTILLSSHLLADVEDVCDRMVILYGGKIRAEGTSDELLRDTERTTINVQRLSDDTVDAVKEVIRQREDVEVESVEQPRQRLEQLFLEIVETARAEQLDTSGATHGGETAAFLRSEDSDGEELIDTLVSEERAAPVVRAREVMAVEDSEDDKKDEVLGALLEEEKPAETSVRAVEKRVEVDAPQDVDDSVISSLLGGEPDGASDDDSESKES